MPCSHTAQGALAFLYNALIINDFESGFLSQFPTFTSFVNTYKDNEMMFKRALVQLEGKDLLLGKPGFPVSEQTTAAHILVIFAAPMQLFLLKGRRERAKNW